MGHTSTIRDHGYANAIETFFDPGHARFVLRALDYAAIVVVTDPKGCILSVNRKFVDISGYSRPELIGNTFATIRSNAHTHAFFKNMRRVIARNEIWQGEVCNRRKNGSLYWVDMTIVPRVDTTKKITHYVGICFDITARKMAEQHLRANRSMLQQAANQDHLTGIANRNAFSEHLKSLFKQRDPSYRFACLCLVDLDTFKTVNDTSGHSSGDRLLKKVATQLTSFKSPECFVARIGGDEFALVLLDNHRDTFVPHLNSILDALRFRFRGGGFSHHCSASMGYAITSLVNGHSHDTLKSADLALYEAKANGGNCLKAYNPRLRQKREDWIHLRRDILRGLQEREFQIAYQPITAMAKTEVSSFEALLRWHSPERGEMTPTDFLEVFEDTELSIALNQFVIKQCCLDIQYLNERKVDFGRISINITGEEFHEYGFSQYFFMELGRYNIEPSRFIIEVTEKMLQKPRNRYIVHELEQLRQHGVMVSLDDFGTGSASLTHLRMLHFDCVKIDKTFIQGVARSGADRAFIDGLIVIVQKMGCKVVAEGVECAEQADTLRAMGCDYAQGWYYAPALPIKALIDHVSDTDRAQ